VRSGWQARRGPAAELREVGLKTGRKIPYRPTTFPFFPDCFRTRRTKTKTVRKRDEKGIGNGLRCFPTVSSVSRFGSGKSRITLNRFLGIPLWIGKIPYFKNRMKYGKSSAPLLWPISRLPNFIPQSNKLDPQLKFIELLAEQPSRYVEEAWSLPG
jgi:hypothetical protein